MLGRTVDTPKAIDGKTSRLICDAVGERLQRSLRPEQLDPSSHLQQLLAELRRRDDESHPRLPN